MGTLSGIVALLGTAGAIWLWYLKRAEKRESPRVKSDKDAKEFEEHLANGDGSAVGVKFDELFQEADRRDRGLDGPKKDG